MKKIISTLVVLFAVFGVQYASACTQNTESMTGGACSIKELQNLEKNKTQQESILYVSKDNLDDKPVGSDLNSEKQNSNVGCKVFGLCLREHLTK